jgi:hypothetical protein
VVAFTRGAQNRGGWRKMWWRSLGQKQRCAGGGGGDGLAGGAWMLPVKVPMGCLARSMDTMGKGGDGTLLASRRLALSTPSSTPLWHPMSKDRGLELLPGMA